MHSPKRSEDFEQSLDALVLAIKRMELSRAIEYLREIIECAEQGDYKVVKPKRRKKK